MTQGWNGSGAVPALVSQSLMKILPRITFTSRVCQSSYLFLSRMASQEAPRNRRERRAQTRQGQGSSSNEIPLARPSREAPTGRTLLEIAEERRLLQRSANQGSPSITTTQINPDGSISEISDPSDPASTSYADIFLYSSSLIILYFTLTLLVHHQYATDRPSLLPLFTSSVLFSPAPWLILILVATLHPRASVPMMQTVFATMAIMAGSWLVKASNDDPYMAVMKKAPPLGTLWVWGIIELRWEVAVGCLAVTGGWGWFHGYSFW